MDQAQELLEGDLPRYYHIKILVLLATTADDLHGCEHYRQEAEMLWSLSQRFHPKGVDESADRALDELRKSLDSLEAALDEERAELDFDEGENDGLHPA